MSRLKNKKSVLLIFFSIAIFALFFYFLNSLSVRASSNFIKIIPDSVLSYSEGENGAEKTGFGWQNPTVALTQDLSEVADFEDFNMENSAYIHPSENLSTVTPTVDGVNSFLEFSSFDVSDDIQKEKIKNVALRFSLAAGKDTQINTDKNTDLHRKLLIEYQSNSVWRQAGEIVLDKDVSNILNGGYFLYALPIFENWEDLGNLKIRFTSSNINSSSVYMDAVWLEVEHGEDVIETKPIDVPPVSGTASLLGASIIDKLFGSEENIEQEEKPSEKNFTLELTSKKKSFKLNEKPSFKFHCKKEAGDSIDSFDGVDIKASVPGLNINPIINYQKNGEFIVDLSELPCQFKPGKYVLKFEINNGGSTFTEEQEFVWGILAINTNKSLYLPSETAYLQMAVLKDDGHTICDASLKLEITNPKSKTQTLLTQNGTIQYSGECKGDNVTNIPDYFAYYQIGGVGTYEMKLINLDNDYEISDSFEVRESMPFEVERVGPTRIYPPADYEMAFKIKANQDFIGKVKETVPDTFQILNSKSEILNKFQIQSSNNPNTKRIVWDVDWKAGETHELGYSFDAPDISPYLYYLGPLKIGDFREERLWQIASDATTTGIVRPDGDTATLDWTPEPTGSHYSTIDDNVTYPTNGVTTDYVDNGGSSGNEDQYTMETITEAATTTAIDIYTYGQATKDSSLISIDIYYDGSLQHSMDQTFGTSWAWATSGVSSLSLNQTSLASLEIYIGGNAGGRTYTVATLYAKITYEASNQTPSVANVSLDGGTTISLVENSSTSVQAVASTTDEDGQSDIDSVVGRIYRSGVTSTEACTLDDNNCYEDSSCVTSSCTGAATSCHATCSFDVWYHAEPTDGTVSQADETPWSDEHWVAWIKTIDSSSASSSATNSSETVEVGSLLALDVSPPIDYDEMAPEDVTDPLSETTTITNTGNCSLDLTLYGVDMESGGDTIAVGKQKYATSSDTYASSTSLLVSPGAELELDLPKTTASSSPQTDDIWWGIEIPNLQPLGTYTGTTTFEAKKNEIGAW